MSRLYEEALRLSKLDKKPILKGEIFKQILLKKYVQVAICVQINTCK